jgi:hypothetical protein
LHLKPKIVIGVRSPQNQVEPVSYGELTPSSQQDRTNLPRLLWSWDSNPLPKPKNSKESKQTKSMPRKEKLQFIAMTKNCKGDTAVSKLNYSESSKRQRSEQKVYDPWVCIAPVNPLRRRDTNRSDRGEFEPHAFFFATPLKNDGVRPLG